MAIFSKLNDTEKYRHAMDTVCDSARPTYRGSNLTVEYQEMRQQTDWSRKMLQEKTSDIPVEYQNKEDDEINQKVTSTKMTTNILQIRTNCQSAHQKRTQLTPQSLIDQIQDWWQFNHTSRLPPM
uniref:Uncharacterized protein n=1 Tax=Arion vulgaris TaxID=1028688 RepID=A0A0B7BG82_9EUPU